MYYRNLPPQPYYLNMVNHQKACHGQHKKVILSFNLDNFIIFLLKVVLILNSSYSFLTHTELSLFESLNELEQILLIFSKVTQLKSNFKA